MSSSDKQSHTLVIARYKENISWVKHVPDSFRILIYNKSKRLPFLQRFRCRRDDRIQVIHVPNRGRESETYLRYMKETTNYGDPKKYTVFCQGDPFEHSPDFLQLLNHIHLWKPLQPLSFRYKKDLLPPDILLKNDRKNFVGELRVRLEPFSVYSMDFVKFHDEFSVKLNKTYRAEHNLDEGTNLSEHFLKICGLPDQAGSAALDLFGQLNYGAIFGVQNSILAKIPQKALESMHNLSKASHIHGYMFERHWLHIFGYPFSLPRKTISRD